MQVKSDTMLITIKKCQMVYCIKKSAVWCLRSKLSAMIFIPLSLSSYNNVSPWKVACTYMHSSYATLEVRNHIFLLQDDAELCEYCSECLFYVSLPNYTQSVLYWMVLELYLQGQLVSLIGVEFRLHLVSFYE